MMDEKTLAIAGAVAGVTVLRRGLRPAAKEAMKGVVALGDATAQARDGIRDMYFEARDEYHSARGNAPEDFSEAVVPPAAPPARRPRAPKPASSPGKTPSSPGAAA